jgi:hypothetical protein
LSEPALSESISWASEPKSSDEFAPSELINVELAAFLFPQALYLLHPVRSHVIDAAISVSLSCHISSESSLTSNEPLAPFEMD